MFNANIIGTVSKFETKETQFGKASAFSIEKKNRKGEVSTFQCIQYKGSKELERAPIGSSVFVSGEADISTFKQTTSVNLLVRHLEILKANEAPQKEFDENDEIPF